MRRLALLLLCLVLLPLGAARAQSYDDDGGMFQIQAFDIDTQNAGGQYLTLKALMVKRADIPSGLPVAVIAHGRPATAEEAAATRLDMYLPQAKDLAMRGYLAVVVLREGFGGSGGTFPLGAACNRQSLDALFQAGADDLQSALSDVRRRQDIDATRIVIIANSAGGPTAAALAARRPNGLADIIAVSGGLREGRYAPDPSCDMAGILSDLYAGYARASAVREEFIYDTRDNYFGPGFYERIHAAFFNAGGQGKAVPIDDPNAGGHNLFGTTAGRADWLRQADMFLTDRYLPAVTSNLVDQMLTAAGGREDMRNMVDAYAHGPGEKAMAVSVSGRSYSTIMGARTLAQAVAEATSNCQSHAQERCNVLFRNMAKGP